MSNYNRITFKERVRIEAGIYAKESFSKIAKELDRSTSSITREVKKIEQRLKCHICVVRIVYMLPPVQNSMCVVISIAVENVGCALILIVPRFMIE